MARKKQTQTLSDDRRVRAECFILCDYAREENGKLYIVGGGWDLIIPQSLPLIYPAFLAVKIVLPGQRAVESVNFRIELLNKEGTALGEPAMEGNLRGTPVENFGDGEELPKATVFLALPLQIQLGQPGDLRVRLCVDDETVAETGFTVAPAQLTGSPIVTAERAGSTDGDDATEMSPTSKSRATRP